MVYAPNTTLARLGVFPSKAKCFVEYYFNTSVKNMMKIAF